MKKLYLADFANMDDAAVRAKIEEDFETTELRKYDVLVAYMHVGSWGCDSSAFLLLKGKKDKQYYEVHGSHCSCYGFEGQFEPKACTVDYLKNDRFYLSTGGYDNDSNSNMKAVKSYMAALRQPQPIRAMEG